MNKLFSSLLLLTVCFTLTACHQAQELARETSTSCCGCDSCSCHSISPSNEFSCSCSCNSCFISPTAHNDHP